MQLKGAMMTTISYETDVAAWANQQAWLIRNRKFELLDIEHLAEEIEDVSKSEQRELASRMAVLIAHLLKWQFQPERSGKSWELTIRNQRKAIERHLKQVPSLKPNLKDAEWDLNLMTMFPPHYKFEFKDPHMSTVAALVS